jgi:hypothetical protein
MEGKMDTAKIYHDIDGNERTIWQMIKEEPEWAAARVQEGEIAIENARAWEEIGEIKNRIIETQKQHIEDLKKLLAIREGLITELKSD